MGGDKKSQIEKFREAARALESDESEAAFDAALKKVATHQTSVDDKSNKSRPKKRDK